MANRPPQLEELTDWAQQAAQALELEPLDQDDVEAVLALASRASAGLVRPAGPVTMYLAGVLLARGLAPDVPSACQLVGSIMEIPELAVGENES